MPTLTFEPQTANGQPLRVLCLGAHADDIEIGCGGAVLHLLKSRPGTEVDWVVFTSGSTREREARRGAEGILENAGAARVTVFDFADGFLPYHGEAVKREFEKLKADCNPDLIFTHYEKDRHQDHRLVNELTWNTFRNHLVLEYEIPKYDGDLGNPSVFMPIEKVTLERKIEVLLDCYQTQRDKHWFDAETFRSLCRVRGMECRSSSGYAEAFFCRKIVILEK